MAYRKVCATDPHPSPLPTRERRNIDVSPYPANERNSSEAGGLALAVACANWMTTRDKRPAISLSIPLEGRGAGWG